MVILLIVGFIEMIIITAWTKSVSNTHVAASGGITFVNVLIWYYVLQKVLEDISNWRVVILYAAGCALGTIAGMLVYRRHERRNSQHAQNPAVFSTEQLVPGESAAE